MVKRGGSFNRYGVSQLETVFSNVPARIEKTTSMGRSVDGDVVEISGQLFLEPSVSLQPRDVITIDNPAQDQYTILDVSENVDILGNVIFRTYDLQQKHKI